MNATLRAFESPIRKLVSRARSYVRYARRDAFSVKPVAVHVRTSLAKHAPGADKAAWAAIVVNGDKTVELSGTFSADYAYQADALGMVLVLQYLRENGYWGSHLVVLPSDTVVTSINTYLPMWKARGFGGVDCADLWKQVGELRDEHGALQFEYTPRFGPNRKAKQASNVARSALGLDPKENWFKRKSRARPGDVVE